MSKYEIGLNQLINNFNNAVATSQTKDLSTLFFGDESKKLILNTIFVPKQPEKLRLVLEQLLLCLPAKTDFLGVDDPANSDLKTFTNLKLYPTILNVTSAQKLSTRLTSVKNNDAFSTPTDGVNVKLSVKVAFARCKDKSLPDSLTAQIEAFKNQMKSAKIESDDEAFCIDGAPKSSTLKKLTKSWKKDSLTNPTFSCRLKFDDDADDLILKLQSADLDDSEKLVVESLWIVLRLSAEISDSEFHELVCDQIGNILLQAKNLFVKKDGLFEVECSTYWLPSYPNFVHIVLPCDKDLQEEYLAEIGPIFNLKHSKLALSKNKAIQLLKTPIKDVHLLVNPHEFLRVNPIGLVGIVHGLYHYHHYMQDSFNDSGWGCAYRSFQTVCSWLRQQKHTEKPIPTHSQIQQCLVDIGDKEPSFIGSRKWIGSTELSFCLETMFGISSRILTTNSGSEIGTHARELLYHFDNYGGPVMIGGGQLAHTILGIDYNTKTGECRYLILDPHYTGGEDLEKVLAGGWCGWKTSSFWNKSDYYNLLLPLTAPII